MKRIILSMALMSLCAFGAFAQSWSKDLEKAAKKGDVEAQLTVGNAYLNGDGVKQNAKKAVKWLFMAAQAGNTEAVKSMCTFYSKELEKVAATGSVDAQFALANFYAEGNGVKQNSEMAYNLYGDAAVQGHKEAKTKLLGQYNPGLEKLAAAGDVDAQFALANFYAEGNGVEKNSEKALSLYGDAAAQGHQEAKPKVLGSYNPGIVKLAKAGDLDAATEVADYLFNGKGGATKNEADAATYYSIAYKAGNKSAGTKLMTMYKAYLNGKGVPKNENLSNIYLAKAASAGIEEAKELFYKTDSPYLAEAARNGDSEALKALAAMRGSFWLLRAIDECKDVNQLVELYKMYDKEKMGVSWPYKDTKDEVVMWEMDAFLYRAFSLDDYLRPISFKYDENGNPIIDRYEFDKYNRDFDFSTVKIDSPNNAYFLIWNNWGSVKQRHILVKRLMNEFNHELAKIAYDEEYFQYDYDSYEIFNYYSNGKYIVKGFVGLDNVVMKYRVGLNEELLNGKKYESEVPSADELKMLVESIPEFAVNPEAVRVIRSFEIGNLCYDIFYLPGLVAYGPKSYWCYGSNHTTFDSFYLSGSKLSGCKMFTESLESKPIYLDANYQRNTLIANADVTEHLFVNYEIEMPSSIKTDHVFSLYSTTIDGQIIPLKYKGSNPLDYKIEGKDNAVMKVVRKMPYDEKGGKYAQGVPKVLEVKDGVVSFVDNPNKPKRGTAFTDAGGADYYVVKHPFTMPDGTTQEFDIPVGYYENFIEFSYTQPDGTVKRYIINANDGFVVSNINVANIKEKLSPDYIETFIKECSESYCVDTAAKLKYGMLENEYEANKNALAKAENDAKWEDFWARMTKEYGKAQVNMLRNSKTVLIKGLDIRLLDAYNWFVYNEFNNDIGAVNLYKNRADGSSVYILERMSSETYIYTRNYKIYDWTTYKD